MICNQFGNSNSGVKEFARQFDKESRAIHLPSIESPILLCLQARYWQAYDEIFSVCRNSRAWFWSEISCMAREQSNKKSISFVEALQEEVAIVLGLAKNNIIKTEKNPVNESKIRD